MSFPFSGRTLDDLSENQDEQNEELGNEHHDTITRDLSTLSEDGYQPQEQIFQEGYMTGEFDVDSEEFAESELSHFELPTIDLGEVGNIHSSLIWDDEAIDPYSELQFDFPTNTTDIFSRPGGREQDEKKTEPGSQDLLLHTPDHYQIPWDTMPGLGCDTSLGLSMLSIPGSCLECAPFCDKCYPGPILAPDCSHGKPRAVVEAGSAICLGSSSHEGYFRTSTTVRHR
jgi:hypothetical protein